MYIEVKSGGTVPDIIGHPGAQESNDIKGANFSKHMDNRLVVAIITPLKKHMLVKDQNVYVGETAWDEYCSDLSNAGSNPPNQEYLQVAMSKLSPVTETFQNNYGDSELLPTGADSILGSKASELISLTGARDAGELGKILKSASGGKNNLMGKFLGLSGDLSEKYNDAMSGFGHKMMEVGSDNNNANIANMGATIKNIMTQPWAKIGWPQMWKNCHFESSYQLITRLYCYNVLNDNEFFNQIYAPLAALKLFVAPRSKDGSLYTDPWMLELKIPGMIYMPLAYMANMNIVIGGDENDFSQTGRPNIVDVTMTINNVYGICVNSETKTKIRPTVENTLSNGIGSAKIKEKSVWMSGGGSSSSKSNDSNNSNNASSSESTTTERRTMSEQEEDAANAMDEYYGR